ncbi:hypothetical protein DFJ67_0277 [Asanoa ferruginea]|uniref:Uncharacterized protein n=1 Tax=Asanoa ferruginea TaxID=53367 RepID=A0A3D9ZBP9_9ACTN|nr:hypothetical protein DFJ67_0277 [Asanoa ferruginea]GIF51129.1 hypothetical protein Afe04nite_56680 [Asanoa ferruginea]
MAMQRETTESAAMRSLPAAFEAACLIRCTGVGRSPAPRSGTGADFAGDFRPGPGPAPGPTPALSGTDAAPAWAGAALRVLPEAPEQTLAEFNQPEAAARLAKLLTDLGVSATSATLVGGGRRQYFVHRVTVPAAVFFETSQRLTSAWRQGRHFLLRTDPVGASSPHNARRETLARRAWQAASLAAGRQRRGGIFGVRLADQEMAAVLVRGARLLGGTASIRSRPGCLQVSVTSVSSDAALLEIATPPLRAAS